MTAHIISGGATGDAKAKEAIISILFSPKISLYLPTAAYSSLSIFPIGLPLSIQSARKSPAVRTKTSQDFDVHLSQMQPW